MTPRNLTILGATGTIGVNTLDVVARHPDKFQVIALTGQNQIEKLAEQCRRFRPRYAVVLEADRGGALQALLAGTQTEVLVGMAALEFVSALPEVDSVMAAIVGAAGLRPALAAARAGKRVLLANKETLVMAGRFFMEAVRLHGALLQAWQLLSGTDWVELSDLLPHLALGLQDERFRRDPVARNFRPYPRARLAWDLWRLRRERALSVDGWRLSLGPATGGSTRDKRRVYWLEDDQGRGQYYLTLRFTRDGERADG